MRWLGELDDRTKPEEVLEGIRLGAYQLFRYPKGIVVTKITNFSSQRRLLVFLLAGSHFDEWKNRANADLAKFADEMGIEVIEAYARPGLEKALRDIGWKKEQVVLRRRKKNDERSVWKESGNDPDSGE